MRGFVCFLLLIAGVTAHLRTEKGAIHSHEGQFTLGKHTYASHEEFIKSGNRCMTKHPTEAEMLAVDQRLATFSVEEVNSEEVARRLAKIEVHFHVISCSNGDGFVSDSDVNAQMTILNNGFEQVNAKFRLKSINRVTNNAWCVMGNPFEQPEFDMKAALRVGGASTLNVYTIDNTEGVLGWATFPWWYTEIGTIDGVVIDYRTLPNCVFAPYNEGATLTHEVGHWMGLFHPFQGGCSVYHNRGDKVKDTPAVASPNFGCPSEATDSCPGDYRAQKGNDHVHNFMDYGDDSCLWEFTKDQKTRMRQNWHAYRSGM